MPVRGPLMAAFHPPSMSRSFVSGGPLLQHLACDDELLDLTGAFIDPEQPCIAEQPLDGIFLDVAVSAVHLENTVGNSSQCLGGEVLAAGSFLGHRKAFVLHPGHP